MRTPLRSKAYVEDGDHAARDPEAAAAACVALLSAAGVDRRGTVWSPA
jgi:hypothetical protein